MPPPVRVEPSVVLTGPIVSQCRTQSQIYAYAEENQTNAGVQTFIWEGVAGREVSAEDGSTVAT